MPPAMACALACGHLCVSAMMFSKHETRLHAGVAGFTLGGGGALAWAVSCSPRLQVLKRHVCRSWMGRLGH